MRAERIGQYQLIGHLASGGMANVYLARVSGIGGFERHVVVKTLHAERVEDAAYVDMFLDEARLIATLHHQHVAQVFEVGRADDGRYFFVMEYVHGETMNAVLEAARARGMRLPLEFGLTVVCAAAMGLHHAHERRDAKGEPLGIVHRDVSPSNVIASYDGWVKLIDFGIAKAAARTTQTQTGFVKGKAGYMAPEQALGYDIDRRSDVFALGVLAYELCTQARAFRASSQFEAVYRTVHGKVRPPSELLPGFPPALEDVILTALETDPDDRFQDADEMRRALEGIANHLGLPLGTSCVVRVMQDLFGIKPEPWMATARLGTVEPSRTPTPQTAPIFTLPAPGSDSVGFARGTGANDSLDDAIPPGDQDEVLTHRIPTIEERLPLPPPTPVVRAPSEPPMPAPMAVSPEPLPDSPEPLPDSPEPLPASREPAPPPPLFAAVRASSSSVSTMLPRRLTTMLSGRRRTFHHAAIVVGAASLACIIGASIAFALVRRNQADSRPTPAPPPASPATHEPRLPAPRPTPPKQTAAAPAPTTITLNVTSDPDGATVVLDGVRLGTTPYTAVLPIKHRDGWLKVRKRHHLPVKIQIPLDHDRTWNPTLPAARQSAGD